MTGLEIIGLVLALYPLVVDILQATNKAVKSGVDVRHLVQRLKTEQIIYNEFVQHLIGSSVSEAERARINDTTPRQENGCWSDPELQAELRRRLGFEKMQNILTIVGNIHKLLESITEEIPGAGRVFAREHSSPLKYLRPTKFFPKPLLRVNLDQLREYNHDLQRLLGVRTLCERDGRRKRRSATIRFLRRDFAHALDIYNALCNGYKCDCDRPHFANLKLPQLNRIEPEHDANPNAEESTLQLLFSIEDSAAATTTSDSAIVDTFESPETAGEEAGEEADFKHDEGFLEQPDFWTSTTRETAENSPTIQLRERRTSQIVINECLDEQCGAIDDLCEFVKTFGNRIDVDSTMTEEELGILCSDQKRYKLHAPHSQTSHSDISPIIVSLHDFLRDQSACKRERMRLALELSYAILQYYSTGWINTSWTWKDFSVTRTQGQEPAQSQLFVTTKFYSVLKSSNTMQPISSTFASEIWTLVGEPILTRLGFALIELAMGERLSELRGNETGHGSMDPDTLDYFTARNILETGKLVDEQGSAYEAVVRACLDHQFYCQTTYKRLDSRQSSFHQDVEECVISPLYSMWVETWG